MSDHLCKTLQRFLETVWNEGNIDAAPEFIADSYAIRHDPGDPWDGKVLDVEGFKNRLRISRTPFPDQRFDVEEMIPGDHRVAVSWRWRGIHIGDIPGLPATGETISMSGLTIYFFVNDKISGHWQVADRLGVMQQLTAAANG